MAESNSFGDVNDILAVAEYFKPNFKGFFKRDPAKVLESLVWALHEEVDRASRTSNKKDLVLKDQKGFEEKKRVAEGDFFAGEKAWVEAKHLADSAILDVF